MRKTRAKPVANLPGADFPRGLRLLPWLLILIHVCPASGQPPAALPGLTNAVQIRELAPAIAQKNLPVRLRGVVTYYDAPLDNLFLQDATAGIFVSLDTNLSATIKAGQETEIEGVSSKGDFAPIVRDCHRPRSGCGTIACPPAGQLRSNGHGRRGQPMGRSRAAWSARPGFRMTLIRPTFGTTDIIWSFWWTAKGSWFPCGV